MSDRDRRRPGDPLHPAGEFDSRDDVTPVEMLRRIEGKIDEGRIAAEVDADMPEHFARLESRCTAAERRAERAERKADHAEARWKWPMRVASFLVASSLGAAVYVFTEVRASGYKARVTEEQRETMDRHTTELRVLRESVIDLRARIDAWRPIRTVPVIGPHDKDE